MRSSLGGEHISWVSVEAPSQNAQFQSLPRPQAGACLTQVTTPGPRVALTFVFVRVVLLLPLGHQDVEVARLLEEAQIPHGDVGGEHPLKLPAPRILVLCFHENADVIWGQDVQDRRIKILQTRAARGQGEVNYVLPAPLSHLPTPRSLPGRGKYVPVQR